MVILSFEQTRNKSSFFTLLLHHRSAPCSSSTTSSFPLLYQNFVEAICPLLHFHTILYGMSFFMDKKERASPITLWYSFKKPFLFSFFQNISEPLSVQNFNIPRYVTKSNFDPSWIAMRGLPSFLQASPKEHLGLPKLREITNYQSLLVLVTLTKEECYNSHLSAFWEAATLSIRPTMER